MRHYTKLATLPGHTICRRGGGMEPKLLRRDSLCRESVAVGGWGVFVQIARWEQGCLWELHSG